MEKERWYPRPKSRVTIDVSSSLKSSNSIPANVLALPSSTSASESINSPRVNPSNLSESSDFCSLARSKISDKLKFSNLFELVTLKSNKTSFSSKLRMYAKKSANGIPPKLLAFVAVPSNNWSLASSNVSPLNRSVSLATTSTVPKSPILTAT